MSYDQLCTARAQFSDIFSDVCPIFSDISDIVGDFEMIFGFFGDFMRDFQFLDVFRTETTTFQNCARVAQNCFSDRFVLVALKSDTFQKTHKKITIFTNSDRFAIFHAFSIKKD